MTAPLTTAELRAIEKRSDAAHLSDHAEVYDGVWSFARRDVPRLIATVKALRRTMGVAELALREPLRSGNVTDAWLVLRARLNELDGVGSEAKR